MDSVSPVFIVGAGRSGTTLLQLALNMHPKLAVFGETQAFFRYRKYGSLKQPQYLTRFLRDWRLIFANYSHTLIWWIKKKSGMRGRLVVLMLKP